MNAESVKEMAAGFGADLIGFAPMSRFEAVEPRNNPSAIFPQGKTVIVIGRRILRGALRGVEEGTETKTIYEKFGLYFLEDQYLAKTTYDLTVWFEAQGFEAVPLFGYDAQEANKLQLGTPVAPGKPAPNVYVDYQLAAHWAGLGSVGRHGLFLTPEFGTRQRFAILITDAELTADPVVELDFCENCDACRTACPLGAYTAGVEEPRQDFCQACQNGAVQTSFGRFNTIDRIAASCGRACLASLEERQLLSRKFQRPFRDAEQGVWSIDYYGQKTVSGRGE